MILDTERLHLRPVVESDVANIQKYFAHWEIVQHMGTQVPWPYPSDGAMTYFKDKIEPHQGKDQWYWAINEKVRPNHLIGMISLRQTERNQDGNRGFWLGLPWHKRGYMTEAAGAVTNYAFEVLDFPQIIATSHISNIASRRVKEKQGMRFLRTEPRPAFRDGVAEQDVFVITREDWLKRKTAQLS